MDPAPAEALLKKNFTIRVIGVGGAGCNAANYLGASPLDGIEFVAMNTDAAALERSVIQSTLVLGSRSMRGLGAGGDPARGRAAAEEDMENIRLLATGADLVFLMAGMGGGTGTGAGPVVARVAKEAGALVLAVVMLPFDCEGTRRQRQAQAGLHDLKQVADGVICLPNQKVFKLIDEKTSLMEAFQITNELVAQGVRSIWRLLTRPGLINVDFADLCTVTQGRHGESTLAAAEARGEGRTREVMEKLLAHPLLEDGQTLTHAAAVLVSIAGGPELSMSDVNRIMEQITRHAESAHMIMGASIDGAMADQLSVTVVAACGGEPAVDEPAGTGAPTDRASVFGTPELQPELTNEAGKSRPPSRFVAPAPELSPEKTAQLMTQRNSGSRPRKMAARLRQGQLALDVISKGRFEKSEPTIHQGQDLDVPTYIRRGVALN